MDVSWCHVRKKLLVSSGARAVTRRLVGAGYSHLRHKLEVQLQPVAGEFCVNDVLLLVVAADPAADHTFIYTLLFYQLYHLYMQSIEKK